MDLDTIYPMDSETRSLPPQDVAMDFTRFHKFIEYIREMEGESIEINKRTLPGSQSASILSKGSETKEDGDLGTVIQVRIRWEAIIP